MKNDNVKIIPATKSPITFQPITQIQLRRVAGYARVSTSSDEQFGSYEAQIDYYNNFIKSHRGWEFVKVYSDHGISALSTKHREGFNEMINDALSGKIDLIITKSISRFARNTLDSLTLIRKLKENGVEVYFEKENIWTFDNKGELLISIMSSIAQEESRSISENVAWGIRKRYAKGIVIMRFSRFLGYDYGFIINKAQAKIIRLIYRLFFEGFSPRYISGYLTKQNIPTPGQKKVWSASVIYNILHNEKYKGDALLQKSYICDYLTKKTKRNEGELTKYYVSNNHEPIILPQEWDMVQQETQRRKSVRGHYSFNNAMCRKIICADCGDYYGRKTWHSNDKYRRIMWVCNTRHECKSDCKTPRLSPDKIHEIFIKAYNEVMIDKEKILSDYQDVQNILDNRIAICETLPQHLEKWEPRIFSHSVDNIKIFSNYTALVTFKNGKKHQAKIPK